MARPGELDDRDHRTARVLTIETPHGPATAHVHPLANPRGALVLGHGAGGGVTARDLMTVAEAAREARFVVALVEQPYRVAGRRAPPRAPTLDGAWTAVVAHLQATALQGLPLVVGGRSSGARVACRTTGVTGAAAVLCLAFPLRPPTRAGKPQPPDRLAELEGVAVPVLVVQGERDPFGVPPPGPLRTVVVLAGDHALRSDLPGVRTAVTTWLGRLAL